VSTKVWRVSFGRLRSADSSQGQVLDNQDFHWDHLLLSGESE
jgi:hypothetical protein